MTEAAVAAVSGVVAAVLTYLGVRRSKSGSVGTSEAQELWEESRLLLAERKDQIYALTVQSEKKDALLEACRAVCVTLRQELNTLQNKLNDCLRETS